MNGKDKKAILKWDAYRKNILRATPIERETPQQKNKRIKRLLNDPESFFKYYFPNYIDSEPATFHIKATKRIVNHPVWFEVRAWARDHAKSVRAMMEVLYLAMKGEIKSFLLVSYSYDNAEELLMPFMLQLESNQRLINDFGIQKNIRQWEIGKFVTTAGVSFRAIGSGQSPRGTRNEETRPDFILVDDIDEDELCRNPRRLDEAHKWLMGALFPTMDIKGRKRFLMIGNIIAKDTVLLRVAANANPDHFEIINILGKNGQPSWKERYSLKDVQYMINKMGYILSQREYFNNPIIEGAIFKDIRYKKPLPINRYAYLVSYTDPSFKSGKNNDYKATVLIGKTKTGEFHVLKAFLEQTTVKKMVEWHYQILDFVGEKAIVFFYMEANFLQDMLLDEFKTYGNEVGKQLPIKGDKRKKPDKFQRIENLEPYFSRGLWFFNENEKNNPHMKRLIEQFQAFQRGAKIYDDGPDACEGAVYILNEKTRQANNEIVIMNRKYYKNPKRF